MENPITRATPVPEETPPHGTQLVPLLGPETGPNQVPATPDDDRGVEGDFAFAGLDEPLPPAKPRAQIGPATVALLLVFMASLGAFGGAEWQKANTPAPTPSIGFGRNRNAQGGNGQNTQGNGNQSALNTSTDGANNGSAGASGRNRGQGGASSDSAGASTPGTSGTVTVVDGPNVYVTDASGNITKLTTNGTTKVFAAAPASLSELKPGDSVTVQGTPNNDGTTTANQITVTPAAPH